MHDRHDIGRGIGFAVLAFALFSASDALVKWLAAAGYPLLQLAATFALFAMLPTAWLVGRTGGLGAPPAPPPVGVGAPAGGLARRPRWG